MARNLQQQAVERLASIWGISEEATRARVEAMPQKRLRDRYRAAEVKASREANMASIYSQKSGGRYMPKLEESRIRGAVGAGQVGRTRTSEEMGRNLAEQRKRERDSGKVEGYSSDMYASAELSYLADKYHRFREGAVQRKEEIEARIRQNSNMPESQRRQLLGALSNQLPPDFSYEYITREGVTLEQQQQYKTLMEFSMRGVSGDDPYQSGYSSWGMRDGGIVNVYTTAAEEVTVKQRNMRVERDRQRLAESYGVESWEDMPKNIRYTLSQSMNLEPVSEYLKGARAIASATGNYYLTDVEYMNNYLSAARDAGLQDEDLEKLEGMLSRFMDMDNADALRDILERRDEEAKISYMYNDKSNPNASDHSDYDTRVNNILKYWERMADEYGV